MTPGLSSPESALRVGRRYSVDISAKYKRKYKPTPAIDEVIRSAYLEQRQGDRNALKRASQSLGWSRSAVCKRGAELGISRAKESPWATREEELLEQFGHLAPSGIQRQLGRYGYQRTIAAIQVKLQRCRIKRNLDGHSACSLADALGVDVHRVLLWIQRGLLIAERRGTDRTRTQGGDVWWIANHRVRRFLLRAPEEIDLARVEKIWFLDVITGGKLYT